MTISLEERVLQERAQLQEEAGRLFGLVIPKKYESDLWLYRRLVESARHWIELEDERQYELLASTVFHSGRVRENSTTPYLFCHGPTGTGKNRIGHWLAVLCQRGLLVEHPSVASLFWTMDRHKPTLIIDEAEVLAPYRKNMGELAEALTEILNAGYQQDQYVPRVNREAGTLKFYDPYGLKVILSTETLPDTTLGRSIIINTEENANQDIPVSHPRRTDPNISELRRYLEYYWGQYQPGSVWHKDPEPTLAFDELKRLIPNYRAVEKFGPLYRVTPDAQAQTHILELACEDAEVRKEERGTGQDAEILQALAHAREAEQVDRYTVADITKRYNENREKWESMSSDQVGRKLRKFGLKPCRAHGGVRCILWDEAKLARRFKRYGITLGIPPILVSLVSPELNSVTHSVTQTSQSAVHGDTKTLGDASLGNVPSEALPARSRDFDETFENVRLRHPEVRRGQHIDEPSAIPDPSLGDADVGPQIQVTHQKPQTDDSRRSLRVDTILVKDFITRSVIPGEERLVGYAVTEKIRYQCKHRFGAPRELVDDCITELNNEEIIEEQPRRGCWRLKTKGPQA